MTLRGIYCTKTAHHCRNSVLAFVIAFSYEFVLGFVFSPFPFLLFLVRQGIFMSPSLMFTPLVLLLVTTSDLEKPKQNSLPITPSQLSTSKCTGPIDRDLYALQQHCSTKSNHPGNFLRAVRLFEVSVVLKILFFIVE